MSDDQGGAYNEADNMKSEIVDAWRVFHEATN